MKTKIDEVLGEPVAKKVVERSAAYPAISIEDAVKFVSEIYRNFRNSFAKRSDILDLIENSHPRHIAAASYYLLLNREKDTYQVSDFYKSIVNFTSEKEKRQNILKAFSAPKLYIDLIKKFDGDEIPKELKAHLCRFHKITEDAAPLAADIFIKNARYCGILDDKNVLNFKQAVLKSDDTSLQLAEIITEEKTENENNQQVIIDAGIAKPSLVEKNSTEVKPKLPEEMVNKEEIKIKLTGKRFAYLIFPDDLSKTDVAILRKQIEQLELIAE